MAVPRVKKRSYIAGREEVDPSLQCKCHETDFPCDHLWYDANTYSDALKLNREFLLGERCCTPYHLDATNDETDPLINTLVDLHEYGILTHGSQPGSYQKIQGVMWLNHDLRLYYGLPPNTEPCSHATVQEDWWFEQRQRPYLEFLLPTADPKLDMSKVQKFKELLLARNDASVIVHEFHELDTPPKCFTTKGSTFEKDRIVTAKRCAASEAELNETEWDHYTSLKANEDWEKLFDEEPIDYLHCWRSEYRNVKCILEAQPMAIGLCSNRWDEQEFTPERIVRECLEAAGIEPDFKMEQGN